MAVYLPILPSWRSFLYDAIVGLGDYLSVRHNQINARDINTQGDYINSNIVFYEYISYFIEMISLTYMK